MTQNSNHNPMLTRTKLIPIFKSCGEVGAFLLFPYIFSTQGEWIGWVTTDRSVYSVHGNFIGMLSKEPRILRKRELTDGGQIILPPSPPPPIRTPAHLPLAPQLPEIKQNLIDVLDEAPNLLPPMDLGELREDID